LRRTNCPKCKYPVKPQQELSILFGEERLVIRCPECHSVFTSTDGIHWLLIVEGDYEKPKA